MFTAFYTLFDRPKLRPWLFAVVLTLTAMSPGVWGSVAPGAVGITVFGAPVTESFDSLISIGTAAWLNDSTMPGWYHARTGTGTTILASNGGSNAGNLYSYGTGTSSDRALGSVGSGNAAAGNFYWGVRVSNDTGATITSLTVSYTGEQWRNSAAPAQTLEFSYRLGTGLGDALADFTTGGVLVPQLSFTSPVTGGTAAAIDGNLPQNRVALSYTITGLSLSPGAEVLLRWTDVDHSGSDHGLAIDDLTITADGGGEPALSINDVSVTEGNAGTMTATFTVSVSSPSHPGVSFDIATADGTGAAPATTADNDYSSNSFSAQQIPANSTTYTFDVVVNGDTAVEADEQFLVHVTNVVGALVNDATGVGTIVNDDEEPLPTTDVVISQVYGGGGNAGATLTHDFIELFNRGTAAINLTGWSVQYASANGTTWFVTPLAGSIAPGGYYLVQQAQGSGGTTALPAPDAIGTVAMAAGSGKVALSPTATALAGACPGGVIDLVGFGGTACFEGAGATPPPSNTLAVVRKRGGCFDSNSNNVDFSASSPNPRNRATPPRSCEFTAAPIHDIQGAGLMTAYLGLDVITSGVVTGVKGNGFFVQTADGSADPDPATSQGMFVFTAAAPAVTAGDEVTVRGTAIEFFTLTQVEASLPGDVAVVSRGNPLPSPVTLTTSVLDPAGTPSQLERFEGMRMHAEALYSVAPTNDFGETATVLPGVPRPMREPGIEASLPVPPDPGTGVVDCCIPRWDQNPERIVIDSDGLAGASVVSVTSFVAFSSVTGPLDFTFGEYKLLPETAPVVSGSISAVPVPDAMAAELTVAGYNIENFGVDTTQRAKAALAIRTVLRYPDVIGHVEIRDLVSLQALAAAVNNEAIAAGDPNPAYEAHLIPASPSATQNVGFLVKTSRIQIESVIQERAGETFVNPDTGETVILHDRPPLVLRAAALVPGLAPRPIIVVVNHLRSFIDIELLSGEGARVRAKRTAQAESLAGLLQELQVQNPATPILSIGDYNAYEFNDGYTDPIAVIKGAPTPDDQVVVEQSADLVNPDFVNLTDALPPSERYTFVFEGTPQALDHVLVNSAAVPYVSRYVIARNNADFPEVPATLFAGDATRPERNSDHDMPVAYLMLPTSSDLLEEVADTLSALVAAHGKSAPGRLASIALAQVLRAIDQLSRLPADAQTVEAHLAAAIRTIEELEALGVVDGFTLQGMLDRLAQVLADRQSAY
jgi:predicted extracellular nuclease